MPRYYLYVKFNNGFEGGFDREIEADNQKEAIKKFRKMLEEPIIPRKFEIYDNLEK